jgi:hypothetical protein
MQSVLVGIPKIHLSVRSHSSFWETDFLVSALNPALFLLSFSFWSLVNGTLPLKILLAHSHRQSTRLRSVLVMRWLRIHGLAFCKYTNSLVCLFKRWETMLFPQHLMQEWQETGCNILFMTRHTLSVPHRERCEGSQFQDIRGVLFHIDHHVTVRYGRSSGKGFKAKLRSPGYIWCASSMIWDTSLGFLNRTM